MEYTADNSGRIYCPCGDVYSTTRAERVESSLQVYNCNTFGDDGNRAAERAAVQAMKHGALSVVYGRNTSAFLWQVWLMHTAYNKRLAAESAAEKEQKRTAAGVVDFVPPIVPASLSGLYLYADTSAESSLRAVHTLHDSPFYKLSMFAPITPDTARDALRGASMYSINRNSPQELYSVLLVFCPAARQSEYTAAAVKLLSDEWHAKQSVIIVLF